MVPNNRKKLVDSISRITLEWTPGVFMKHVQFVIVRNWKLKFCIQKNYTFMY